MLGTATNAKNASRATSGSPEKVSSLLNTAGMAALAPIVITDAVIVDIRDVGTAAKSTEAEDSAEEEAFRSSKESTIARRRNAQLQQQSSAKRRIRNDLGTDAGQACRVTNNLTGKTLIRSSPSDPSTQGSPGEPQSSPNPPSLNEIHRFDAPIQA